MFIFQRFSLWILVSCFATVLFMNAWIADDAYITFRTIDNVNHGYGLRWNIDERVQTFTHPLWLLLLTPVHAATHNPYYSTLFISSLLTIATFYVITFRSASSYIWTLVTGIAFLLSKAFIDYASSGLENPLSYLIVAILIWYILVQKKSSFFVISLLASLAALNRLDLLLLFLPLLLFYFIRQPSVQKIKQVAIGFLPLLAWEVFSLFYYGSLLPTTAIAKLNVDIPRIELWQQGIYYLLDSLHRDPLTLFIISAAAVVALLGRKTNAQLIVLGVVLYVLYTTSVGGDFMSGRFLSVLFVASMGVLTTSHLLRPLYATMAVGVAIIWLGLINPFAPIYSTSNYHSSLKAIREAHGIADERAYYYPTTGLLNVLTSGQPLHPWVAEGLEANNHPAIVVRRSIGFFGYYAGPQVHVVDLYGLGDPLLARLPHLSRRYLDEGTLTFWRIGHFRRGIPQGYIETLQTNKTMIKHPDLAAYYNLLHLITNGQLLDPKRLTAIWQLNTSAGSLLHTYHDDENRRYTDNDSFSL